MKRLAIGMGLALAASAANAQSVEVGEGDWSNVPAIRSQGNLTMSPWQMTQIENLARAGTCQVEGLRRGRVDLTIPFVIQFNATGQIERIVLRNQRCPQLEGIVGGAVLRLAQAGEFRPTGENAAGWYRSQISFASN